MTSSRLQTEIKRQANKTTVLFKGEFDEQSDFEKLPPLSGEVIFDLAGVRRINSEGVRRWILFLRSLESVEKLAFVRCSIPIVTQLNMIRGFEGGAEIRSFYAPYACSETGEEEARLLTREALPDPLEPPTFPCEGGVMELDDIPERYFAFLIQGE